MKRQAKTATAILLSAFLLTGLISLSATRLTWTTNAQTQSESAQAVSPFVPARILVQFRPETTTSRGRRLIDQAGASDAGKIPGIGVHIVELPTGADEEAFVQAFKSQPEVEVAELDRIIAPASVTPNDPWYPNEWYLGKISASNAWSTTTGSSNITIAILDTGVDSTHPDLASKMVPGRNVFDNNSNTADVGNHGTPVAGTAAAAGNNGIGVSSVAWGCRIMPVRVSDANGYATYSSIASGLTWAADHGARVANISYIVSDSSTVTAAAAYFQNHGGVVTSSAGNYSTFDSSADNPYILTISATDVNDILYSWSNTGNNVDLASPGLVFTTYNGGGYDYAGGSSFSAPIVAGVAALVLSVNPNLSGSQVQDILKQSADDLGPAGWDSSYGWGRVNAARAVSLASGGGGLPDTTPPTVSFTAPASGATVSGTFAVQMTANDNVGVASVALSVDGVLLAADNTPPYTFSWNTANVGNGAHTLMAMATDAAGNSASASVSVTVNNAADTTAPTISITSPGNGANVTGNVSVLVSASDNVAVVRVGLFIDGVLTSTSTSAPFTVKWNTKRAAAGGHTLQCRASDAANNAGTSSTVTVYK